MIPPCLLRTVLVAILLLPAAPALAGKAKTTPAKPAAASASSSAARRAGIVTFCRNNAGRKVGNGECWTLANEAFKATGAQRPAGQLRVWGRRLDLKKEAPQPGDILECDRTHFSDGSYTTAQHTAVIVGVKTATLVRIAEQNFAGSKKVKERDLELSGLKSGKLYVYRPE